MTKMSETILFFGSGPVAASSLAKLAESFEIEAVITKPKPSHHKPDFPVISLSQELGLKTYTPTNILELTELFKTNTFTSPVGVVIDYGLIIPKGVIDYFPLGIVNSHFSLLPKLRGADPISFAILEGHKETGVSLMLIVEALDEGPILAQRELKLNGDETTPKLTEALIEISDELLKEVLPAYIRGEIRPKSQVGQPSYSKKLNKADGQLDFKKTAARLEREVRAYLGWPRSYTTIKDRLVIVTSAHVATASGSVGQLVIDNDTLSFYTSDGVLVIDSLIPEGKKEMSAKAFLAGYQTN